MIGIHKIPDPVAFQQWMWPDVTLYDKQWELVLSAEGDKQTVCPAGNMLGKDWVAGFIAVSQFCRYGNGGAGKNDTVRIVPTSVDKDQLRGVLWGEIKRWIQTMRFDCGLVARDEMRVTKVLNGKEDPISYLWCRVASRENDGAGLLGHHATHTLGIIDEASGFYHDFKLKMDAWAKHLLVIGNPYPCVNFFKYAVKGGDPLNPNDRGGDIVRSNGSYYRRVIKITAEDSPNVKYARWQQRQGILEPDNTIVLPGVLTWEEYQDRRNNWDKVSQCRSLDAEFWEGEDALLYPPERLNLAEMVAMKLRGKIRKAETIGCDPAEGGDSTCWCVTDRYGIIKMVSKKTPNTAVIVSETIRLMREFQVPAHKVYFDRGGGGQQHADQLRERGYAVQTVGFGETVSREMHRGMTQFNEKKEGKEERYAYKNRRAEMAGMVMEILDPDMYPLGFGIPAEYIELRRQMAPIPKLYDGEGRLYLPPKGKVEGSTVVCLKDLLGRSPDDFDSLCLAVYGMRSKRHTSTAGAV